MTLMHVMHQCQLPSNNVYKVNQIVQCRLYLPFFLLLSSDAISSRESVIIVESLVVVVVSLYYYYM